MNRLKAVAVAVVSILVISVSGCARLSIPAPKEPVPPFAQPALEDSVISLPLSLQTGIPGIDRLLGSGNESLSHSLGGRVRKFLDKQASKNNDTLLQSEHVRQATGWAWNALQTPVKLKDDYYLLLNPEALRLSPPAEQQDRDAGMLGVVELIAKPKVVAGLEPKLESRPTPSISMTRAPQGKGFHLALESEISFAVISRELTGRLKNKVYTAGGRSMKIESIRMYASGSSAVLEVRIAGDNEGALYLSGIPDYDQAERRLIIRNIDYTVATKNILVKAADWMLHTELRRKLEEQARWPLGDRIDEAGDMLAKALNRELGPHAALRGAVASVRPAAIGLTEHALKAVLIADGTVELKVF